MASRGGGKGRVFPSDDYINISVRAAPPPPSPKGVTSRRMVGRRVVRPLDRRHKSGLRAKSNGFWSGGPLPASGSGPFKKFTPARNNGYPADLSGGSRRRFITRQHGDNISREREISVTCGDQLALSQGPSYMQPARSTHILSAAAPLAGEECVYSFRCSASRPETLVHSFISSSSHIGQFVRVFLCSTFIAMTFRYLCSAVVPLMAGSMYSRSTEATLTMEKQVYLLHCSVSHGEEHAYSVRCSVSRHETPVHSFISSTTYVDEFVHSFLYSNFITMTFRYPCSAVAPMMVGSMYTRSAVEPLTMNNQPMRVIEVNMERHWNEGTGETGDPRENPPTNSIVRHYSHLRKSGETAGD
ncbi:hypothetical protein PR048_033369 [Dryococelus australis]|uniref:Uncharacterized protein n=1 Tax=Dryococelus australis TaxID=614101 RepID=A0ABQ9G1D4_9NEOP|nr:hypothetical protein PR048_033369 [Dryococelus australis]